MTIRNLKTFIENLWDWGFLDQCFGSTKIKVTDIDGLVERKGHFLLIETKSMGVNIPKGQQILFDALMRQKNWDVMIIWGAPGKPEFRQFWGSVKVPTNKRRVIKIVASWFCYANHNKF